MESDLFAGVDELEKSQFLGNFFHWMRNIFTQVKRADVTPLVEKDERMRERPVEQEPIVVQEQAVQLKDNVKKQKMEKTSKQGAKAKTLAQQK